MIKVNYILVFLLALVNSTSGKAQIEVNLTQSYTRFDFFTAVRAENHYDNNGFISAELGFGNNSTFFVGQPFPKLSVGVGYSLIESSKIRLESLLQINFLTLKTDQTRNNYYAASLGYAIKYGDVFYVVQDTYFGLGQERSGDNRSLYINYQLGIGLGYAF